MGGTIKVIISDDDLGSFDVTQKLASVEVLRILHWIKLSYPTINTGVIEDDIVETRPAETKESIDACLRSTFKTWIEAGNELALRQSLEETEKNFE